MRGTLSHLSALPVDGGPPQDLNDGTEFISNVSLDPTGAFIGFTAQSITSPPEAFVSRIDRFSPIRISRVNEALAERSLGRSEVIRWKSSDGAEIEGIVTYPAGYKPGERYPTLLIVHMGGEAFSRRYLANPFDSSLGFYPAAVFAAHGFAVLQCNSRGGGLPGYGREYSVPAFRVREKAYHDVMTGIDNLIDGGIADGARLGIMGWSNGGLVTSWMITQTRRFKAASVGAGFPDLVLAAAFGKYVPYDLGAEPWDDLDVYRAHSPIFHTKDVNTPTLIQHGEFDEIVALAQGYELHSALKRQGVPVTMVIYPRAPHVPQDPKQVMDIARRNVEWFDRYLRMK